MSISLQAASWVDTTRWGKRGRGVVGRTLGTMLKLTMNPRKRSKRSRSIPDRLRLPPTSRGESMEDDEVDTDLERSTLEGNLSVLLKQEASGKYICSDYLSSDGWQKTDVYQLMKKPKIEHSSSQDATSTTRIDEYCREQIVEWSFRVVDYFRIDREVVFLSLSFLDRFLAKCQCDRTSFKLAATTTLHLAVKLLYPCKLADLGILSDLSRGEFDMRDVCEMESHILRALSWNLHPPTATAFGSLFLDFFFASHTVHLSNADLDDIYDVSGFFSELSVCDYRFCPVKGSTIAIAAILNSLEGMFGPQNSLSTQIATTAKRLGVPLPPDSVRNRLWELYERSEECALHHEQAEPLKTTMDLSPVTVKADYFENKLRNESW